MENVEVAVHQIEKDENQTGATVTLSNDYLDSRGSKLIQDLDNLFIKKSPKMAKFSEDGFKNHIENFSSFDLLEISRQLSEKLKDQISNVTKAKGGYILFCLYKTRDKFLSIFILRNTKTPFFKRAGDRFSLEETTHLDIRDFCNGSKNQFNLYQQ